MSEDIKIPNGWESVELGEILKILTDYTANGSFETLKNNVQYYNNKEYAALVRTTDLNKRNFTPERFTDYKGWKFLRKTTLHGNEILIANVGSAGNVYRAPIYNQPMTLAPNMYLLKFKNKVSEDYLYYVLINKIFKIKLLQQLGSTTLEAINKDNLRSIDVLIPKSKQEQQKIAQILNEIDNAILKTKELLEKNKRLKTALMQDLLSFGIDENENIRNSKTHKFKRSKLGFIPKEWECVELGEICDILMGQSPNGFSINQSFIGMPFLQGNADFKDKFPLEKNWTYRPTKIAKKYSILLSVRAPVGEINIADKNYCIGRGLASIQSKNHSILFLFFAIKYHNYKLKQLSQGSTFEAINRNNIEKIQIKFPKSKTEQQKISQILSSQDEKIQALKNKLTKLKSLKVSLMQDLLSGKVRATKLME